MPATKLTRYACDFCAVSVEEMASDDSYDPRRPEGWSVLELDRNVSAEVNTFLICPAHLDITLGALREKVEKKRVANMPSWHSGRVFDR